MHKQSHGLRRASGSGTQLVSLAWVIFLQNCSKDLETVRPIPKLLDFFADCAGIHLSDDYESQNEKKYQ